MWDDRTTTATIERGGQAMTTKSQTQTCGCLIPNCPCKKPAPPEGEGGSTVCVECCVLCYGVPPEEALAVAAKSAARS